MAMDFFARQDLARRRSSMLVGYFVLAVLLTVFAVNAVFFVLSAWLTQPGLTLVDWFSQPWWAWVTLGTLAIIGGGSLLRFAALRDGGESIAAMVNARRVDPDTKDARERQLLNIVEEMSIAAGMAAPSTWIMDHEQGINAFVAGYRPSEAVLVLTRGALENFDRNELQGVVGHEFSHILNGDMRLNIHLMAVLAGILAIGRVGEFLLRSLRGRRTGGRDSAKGALPVLAIGLALMVIGYIGLFFGRLIKAAISRQREFLADASSVQFTRNPGGIAGALLKIRDAGNHGLLDTPAAEDMSHMCIALPVRIRLAGLLATHPPLDERIAAIDPSWLARGRARARAAQQAVQETAPTQAAGFAGAAVSAPPAANTASPAAPAGVPTPASLAGSVGTPTPEHLRYAERLRESIPGHIRELFLTPAGARLLAYGLLVTAGRQGNDVDACRLVAEVDSPSLGKRLAGLLPEVRALGTRLRLPCLDLAMPALRTLSATQRRAFLDVAARLAPTGTGNTVAQYALLTLLHRHLEAPATPPVRHRSYRPVMPALNVLVSMLCHADTGDEPARRALHARVMATFGGSTAELLALPALDAGRLATSLDELSTLSPLLKKPVMDACIDCVTHDGRLQVAEIELARAVGAALECPVPPFLGIA
jgi:Zn-dependent protease with chaperone function